MELSRVLIDHHLAEIETCMWFMEGLNKTYLSEPVAVSFSGCRNDNLLSPVLTIEVFQIFFNGLQPGQFSRKVNRCDARMVRVPVQLFLQSLVDLIQWTQEELKKKRHKAIKSWYRPPQKYDYLNNCAVLFLILPYIAEAWPFPSGSSASVLCFLL